MVVNWLESEWRGEGWIRPVTALTSWWLLLPVHLSLGHCRELGLERVRECHRQHIKKQENLEERCVMTLLCVFVCVHVCLCVCGVGILLRYRESLLGFNDCLHWRPQCSTVCFKTWHLSPQLMFLLNLDDVPWAVVLARSWPWLLGGRNNWWFWFLCLLQHHILLPNSITAIF